MEKVSQSAWLAGLKMSIAGALAFCLSQYLQWPYNYWSVVTVAAVTRPGLTDTLGKIITRIIGTLIGSTLGYFTLVAFGHSIPMIILLVLLTLIISCYIGLQKSVFNYSGIIIGLSLIIVVSTGIESQKYLQVYVYRTIDVLLGVACIAIVNYLLKFFVKKEPVLIHLKEQFKEAWVLLVDWKKNKKIMIVSIYIAIAATITFIPWLYLRYPGGYWAPISCLFVMEENIIGFIHKSWRRFFSHVVAALIGTGYVLLSFESPWWLLIPLFVSFFIFGYIMVSSKTFSFSGNTMGIALSTMLLGSPGGVDNISLILSRFFNVMGGMMVGFILTYVFFRYSFPKN